MPQNPHHDRRWAILALLGVAQLIVVLDATLVNIALPSAQTPLDLSTDNRQWSITAYSLAFGGLLLLGGGLPDLFGRTWTVIVGLVGFATASAIAGAASPSSCPPSHRPSMVPPAHFSRPPACPCSPRPSPTLRSATPR